MEIRNFSFKGYQNYEPIQESLDELLKDIFGKENLPFLIAINEAVLNAAKYSVYGLREADIHISVRILTDEVRVTVASETHPFDAVKYRERLQSLLVDEVTAALDWGDYIGDSDAGRGFWYILTAVDYLYIDEKGQEITLVARIPMTVLPEVKRLDYLIPKFYVRQNGVIS